MDATTLASVEDYLNTSFADADREYVDGRILERNVGEIDHSDLQTAIVVYLRLHHKNVWAGVEVRVQVSQSRFRVPDICIVAGPKPSGRIVTQPPLCVVEVLSKDDRVDDIDEKIHDYLAFGIRYVWVVNPRTRHGYVYTASGMHEATDGILHTANPSIQLPLWEMFQ